MTCPKCLRAFVLLPDDEPPDRSRMMGKSTEPEFMTKSSPVVMIRPTETEKSDEPIVSSLDAPLAVALVSIAVIGIAIVLGQIPYGRFAAVGLALLGALAGGVCLFGLEKRRWLGWVGLSVNFVVFNLMLFLPTWLGATSWLPPVDPNENLNNVYSIAKDGAPNMQTDAVDASVAAWQQNDVRVEVDSARIVFLNPTAKTADERKVRGLKLTIKISNVGVARAIECTTTTDPSTELRLSTVSGQAVNWKKAESAFKPSTLFPGKTLDCLLVFDVPLEPVVDLKLEIPANWFGNRDPIRLRIPAAMIAKR